MKGQNVKGFSRAIVGSYTDFKLMVQFASCNQYCFYYQDGSPLFTVICVNLISGLTVRYSGSVSVPGSFSTDFPSAVTLTSNPPAPTSAAFAGPKFFPGNYADFKTVVSTFGINNNVIWLPAASAGLFSVQAYSPDFEWVVQLQDPTTPATFTTDFPNAIELASTSSFPTFL